MRFHKFFLLIPVFLAMSSISRSQDQLSAPPAEVIQAARAAFPEYDRGMTFDLYLKSADELPKTVVIAKTYNPSPEGSVRSSGTAPNSHIRELVAKADFVGIGSPTRRWTYTTTGNVFAVSIYLVHLSRVSVPGNEELSGGSDVYVVRPGGPFTFGGHDFRAIDSDFPLFHLNEPYLFFGTRITPTLYKVDSQSTLKVEQHGVAEVSNRRVYADYYSKRDIEAILQEAFIASQSRADKRGRQ